jgi:hypothetical protein
MLCIFIILINLISLLYSDLFVITLVDQLLWRAGVSHYEHATGFIRYEKTYKVCCYFPTEWRRSSDEPKRTAHRTFP